MPQEMHAVQGNLLDPADPSPAGLAGPEFFDFDIAVVGLGFHHFDDRTQNFPLLSFSPTYLPISPFPPSYLQTTPATAGGGYFVFDITVKIG